MNTQADCYNPAVKYKPQWAYETPDGYIDEVYLIEFSFTLASDGRIVRDLPVQLDDDVPYILHAIVFPNIGPFATGTNVPGLISMRDTQGNPITDGLILFFGAYGLSGFENQNAFGFPFEPAIVCDPGGALLFDVQFSSTGTFASNTHTFGSGAVVMFFAALMGAVGNGLTIQLINPGANNVPLSVAVVGGIHVQVTLATDGGGTVITTAADIQNLLNNTPALQNIMGAQDQVDGLVAAFGPATLTGGNNASSNFLTVNGTLIGKKRRKAC